MAGTQYDVILNSVKLRILRNAEGPGYQRRTIRREVQQQLLTQQPQGALALGARDDTAKFYQTDWSGGAQWWKPLMGPENGSTYHKSKSLDVWSRPGQVYPINDSTFIAGTANELNAPYIVKDETGALYMIGETSNVDATQYDVYKWSGSGWTQQTGYSSGSSKGNILALAFDPADQQIYNVAADGFVNRFDPGVGEDKDWISGVTVTNRKFSFCLSKHGLFLYDGDQLFEVDKSTPALTSRVDDGLGLTMPLSDVPAQRLAVGTPEGIYYVKNLIEDGDYRAWVFRVDRDEVGNYITEPIETLPLGVYVSSVKYHLGALVLAGVRANESVNPPFVNDNSIYPVDYYQVDSQSGLSVLGAPTDGDNIEDGVAWIVGSAGPYLYMAGYASLWVYDGARGGFHKVMVLNNAPESPWANGAFYAHTSDVTQFVLAANYEDQSSMATEYFPFRGSDAVSTSNGDHQLESNFFDFGLPMETKELSKVEILRDAGSGSSTWRVDIDVDDAGSWTNILSHATSGETYASADLSGTSGRRFRYRLEYRAAAATHRHPLRALLITALTGDMITEWELLLDGSELLNVSNEVQDEEAFFDNLVTIAGTATQIDFLDNFKEQAQETDDGATATKVKVQSVQIMKDKPGESVVRVVLREAV